MGRYLHDCRMSRRLSAPPPDIWTGHSRLAISHNLNPTSGLKYVFTVMWRARESPLYRSCTEQRRQIFCHHLTRRAPPPPQMTDGRTEEDVRWSIFLSDGRPRPMLPSQSALLSTSVCICQHFLGQSPGSQIFNKFLERLGIHR